MNLEERKNFSEEIRNYSLVLAVVIGGIWAIFTFVELKQKQHSELELEKVILELEKAKLVNQRQAVVGISIEAKQMSIPNNDEKYIFVEVELTNKGNRNTHLESDRAALIISELIPKSGKIIQSYYGAIGFNYMLRVNDINNFPYLVRVYNSGFYKVLFEIKLTKDELEIAEKYGQEIVTNKGEVYWTGEKIIYVK